MTTIAPTMGVASGRPLAPVDAVSAPEPVDLDALAGVVTRWLRETRHGSGSAVCWACPVDAAGLVARVDRARIAGLL